MPAAHPCVCLILVAAAAVVVYLRPGVPRAGGAATQPAERLQSGNSGTACRCATTGQREMQQILNGTVHSCNSKLSFVELDARLACALQEAATATHNCHAPCKKPHHYTEQAFILQEYKPALLVHSGHSAAPRRKPDLQGASHLATLARDQVAIKLAGSPKKIHNRQDSPDFAEPQRTWPYLHMTALLQEATPAQTIGQIRPNLQNLDMTIHLAGTHTTTHNWSCFCCAQPTWPHLHMPRLHSSCRRPHKDPQ